MENVVQNRINFRLGWLLQAHPEQSFRVFKRLGHLIGVEIKLAGTLWGAED